MKVMRMSKKKDKMICYKTRAYLNAETVESKNESGCGEQEEYWNTNVLCGRRFRGRAFQIFIAHGRDFNVKLESMRES